MIFLERLLYNGDNQPSLLYLLFLNAPKGFPLSHSFSVHILRMEALIGDVCNRLGQVRHLGLLY